MNRSYFIVTKVLFAISTYRVASFSANTVKIQINIYFIFSSGGKNKTAAM
ncbi:hypothetical protein [Sporosarcina sp. FA15]